LLNGRTIGISSKLGGAPPREEDPDVAFACCPDPYNTVVFKLTRKAG